MEIRKKGKIRTDTPHDVLDSRLVQAMAIQYKALIENLPQRVFLKDTKSVYISCNTNFANDINIKPEEITGKTDYDFFPASLAEKYRADDKRVMESGKAEKIEEKFRPVKNITKKPDERFVDTVKVPVMDKTGNVTGILGLYWDITEHRQAELNLKESEEKFRTIFENAREGIILADPKTKKFYTSNDAIRQMLGYTIEEMKNLSVKDIHPEKDLPDVLIQFEKQAGGEISLARGLPIKRKDGSVFHADVNATSVNITGETYLMGFFHDITPEKMAEEEKARAEKMQVSSDMKSKLVATVSHEFRSPLATIKEGVSLVLDGSAGSISDEQKDILSTAKKNIERLNRLIDNILIMGKIEVGKMGLNIEEADINKLVADTGRTMYILASDKGLDLAINIDEDMPEIMIDIDRIVQVITNLLSNAIKFTERGGITLTTKREDSAVHVIVRDTGPGIRSEDIPKLFGAFETFGGTAKTKGGTGLGLMISKDIISAHNGKIWVESPPAGEAGKLGEGAAFHFTLPIKR